MPYTLEQLSDDIRKQLKADSGPAGKQAVAGLVSKVLLDEEFVAQAPDAGTVPSAQSAVRGSGTRLLHLRPCL